MSGRPGIPAWASLAVVLGINLLAAEPIGEIEFFGYKGLDVGAVAKALPVHAGDAYTERTKSLIRQSVLQSIGKEPTDVAAVCCDEQGNSRLFIGLPGASSRNFTYRPEPQGDEQLPPELMNLYTRLDNATEAAVRRGGEAALEDDSQGYRLTKDPGVRALELEVRAWAVAHENELLRVLENSSAAEHRRNAADALGYANQSRRQILALADAARDADDIVRNNAMRALGVLARSGSELARDIPADAFVEMLNSGRWTDRNKSSSLLRELTAGRDADLLAKLRHTAFDSLVEMARWRDASHAYFARMLLGRMAGMPEEKLAKLAWDGPVQEIIQAATPH